MAGAAKRGGCCSPNPGKSCLRDERTTIHKFSSKTIELQLFGPDHRTILSVLPISGSPYTLVNSSPARGTTKQNGSDHLKWLENLRLRSSPSPKSPHRGHHWKRAQNCTTYEARFFWSQHHAATSRRHNVRCRTFENYTWHAAPDQYLTAAYDAAGVIPLIVPSFGDGLDIDAILDGVDGVLVTGSKSNVHPALYGVAPTEAHEPYDTARTLRRCRLSAAPSSGAFPFSRFAVEFRNSMLPWAVHWPPKFRNLTGAWTTALHNRTNRQNDSRFASCAHQAGILSGQCHAKRFYRGQFRSSASHRQPAPQLDIEAVADDGTIEAVSVKNARSFAVGVQWHPEYWVKSDSPSRKIFAAFGEPHAPTRQAANGCTPPGVDLKQAQRLPWTSTGSRSAARR